MRRKRVTPIKRKNGINAVMGVYFVQQYAFYMHQVYKKSYEYFS